MDSNPIYKFMKENNLTQMDEASFNKAYSDPQKSAQIHKFMVDNKLTNLDAGAFHSAYFDTSKKKVSTDSSEPAGQPGQPSAPSTGQSAFDAWNPAFKKAEPETELKVERESKFAPKQLDGAYDTWRKSITKEAKDYGLQIGYEKSPEEDEVSLLRKAASDQLGKKSYTPEEQQQIQEIEDKIKKGEEVEMLKPEMGVGTGWRLGEFSLNNSPEDVSSFYQKASEAGLDDDSSNILNLTNKKAEGSFYGESTMASRSYAEKAANLWFDLLSEKNPSKASYEREKYNKIKSTPENERSSDDEKFLRDTEGRAIELHAAGKNFRLNRVTERINDLNGRAVTDEQKLELDNLFEEYGKLDNSLMGMEKADKLNRMQYGYISRVESAEDEWKQDRDNKLSQGDGKLSQFFQSALGAMSRGAIGIGQVPKVFGDLIGDKDYDYWDETYDSLEGTKRGISAFYNDLPRGKKASDLPFTARLALVGGNAVGSASLFIGGGILGGASRVGQTAATFGTAFLTSEADYYQEALDAGMDSQSAALFGTYLATQSAILESIIPDVKYLKTPEFRRSVRNSVMKRFNSGMPLKEAMKFGYKDALKTLGESGLSYLKTGTKEAFFEELPTQIVEDFSKTAANAAGQKKYFNDTFDGDAYVDAILGSFVAGPGMNLLSRPDSKSPVQEEVIREIAERKDKLLKKGTASDKATEPESKKEIEDTAEILNGMKAHSGWNNMSREEQNHALATAQQIEVIKKEQEKMKKIGIEDETKNEQIKQLENEVNEMFSMQLDRQKQAAYDAKLKAIEDEFNKSIEGEEYPVQEDERDQEIVELQKQREERGVNEIDTFFNDMKPMVPFAVERMEQGQPVAQSVKQAASNYLYKKYKELTDMKSNPNRMMTRQQIANVQKQLEQDIRTLEGTTETKAQVNDQENIQGIPSEVGVGQEPVTTQPIEVTSEEAPATGGVLQAQGQEEVVTPQVTEEPAAKPARKTRLAKMFETSEGETSAGKVAEFLKESNIGVEVLDPKDFEETGKQRNFEGDADGIFLVDNNTGKIYLNKDKIKTAEGKTIAFHEGIHPVVNIIRNTNPKQYQAIVQGLKAEAARNNAVAEAADAVAASEYYQEQGPLAIEDETVVETMARVAAGDIDIDTFEPTFREKFIEFMNKLAKMLGLGPIAVNSPRVEVKRLADQLSKALNEGGKISDVVGKKNVSKFQNTIGTPTSIVQSSNLNRAPKVKVNPKGHSLSFVQPSDIKDISSLIKEIADKNQKVWFWVADQLGRGLYFDSVIDGYHFLDAGPSFALDPENRKKNIIWATGKNQKEIEKLMGQTDYIFIISGSPQLSKLFNKKISEVVFNRIEKAIIDQSADKKIDPFNEFKKEILGVSKVSSLNSILNSVNSFDELLNSPKRKQFLINMLDQQSKQTPLKKLFEKYNAFVDLNEFRDGFYADNNFELNDIMLVLKPTGFGGTSKHSTYENDVLGEVIGVPDRKINAYDIMTDEFKSKYGEMPRTQQQQTVAPYGIGVRSVQPSKGIKRGSNLVKDTYYEAGLTEDKNDYVFFHVSSAPKASIMKGIDSTKYTSLRTAREEKGLQYGVASYYTRPEDGERMVGGDKYAVRVPKGKVYPIDSDPMGYGEKAEENVPQGTPFRGEAVKREIADMAKKDGYQMIVGEWSYSRTGKPAGEIPEFRADALVPLKPTAEKPTSFTSNAEKGMERIPFPSQQSEQAKQELENIASEVRDIMSGKKKFSSKEYKLADSVYMSGQVTENKDEDNEFKRDITPEEYDMMTKVLPKNMQEDAARVRGLLFGGKKKGQASKGIARTPKEFAGNVGETIDRIKAATSEDGATLNLDGTTYEDGGLVVPAGSLNVAQDEVSADGLFEFLKDNEGNISSDIFKIGLYKFPDRPEVSYDLNIVIPREYRDVALKFGELSGQESLFDLDTFENIKTGSDGKNPRKFTAQELAEIAKDLSEGRLPKIVSKEEIDRKWGEKKMIALTKRDELGTETDREIAAYASKFLNKFGPYTKANVVQIMNMSAEEKIKLINDTFEARVKKMNPAFREPGNDFYDQSVKRRDEVLALVTKPTVQPSMVKRTPAQIRQAVEDGVDAVEAAIAEGMDPQQAVDENISNQDWYGDLSAAQKEQLNEILQDEFGATASEPKATTPIVKQIASIVDNYYKLKDGDRSARAAINEILGSDPKLKYIYDNISKINKQLQDAGVITDKTDGCP